MFSVEELKPSLPLPGVVVGTALLATVVRYQLNAWLCGAKLFKPSPSKSQPRATLLEECWLLVCTAILLALSTWALLYHNGGCTFMEHEPCFVQWHRQINDPQQQFVYSATLGWYLHGLIKSLVPGVGLHAGNDMVAHHFVTVASFAAMYVSSIERIGMLLLAILNLSNPLMHFAKILHSGGAPHSVQLVAFSTFAVAFFVSRLVMFPFAVYWGGVKAMLRELDNGSLVPGIVCLSLATFLQALQVYWMYKIVRVLVNDGNSSKKASTIEVPTSDDVDATVAVRTAKRTHAGGRDDTCINRRFSSTHGRNHDASRCPPDSACNGIDGVSSPLPEMVVESDDGSDISQDVGSRACAARPVAADSAHGFDSERAGLPGDVWRQTVLERDGVASGTDEGVGKKDV